MTPLFARHQAEAALRQAAWIARCVGDPDTSPFSERDLQVLARYLETRRFERGEPVFTAGQPSSGVWIVREGMLELTAGSGRRKVVVHVLHAGNVDGDVQLILRMPLAYSARAIEPSACLFLSSKSFEALLADHPAVMRRWLSSCAARVSRGQMRLIGLLGKSLVEQTAQLLLDEQERGRVPLPQRTIAAMLGVRRPSLNKVLKNLEKERVLALGYGHIDILDPERLEQAARGRL